MGESRSPKRIFGGAAQFAGFLLASPTMLGETERSAVRSSGDPNTFPFLEKETPMKSNELQFGIARNTYFMKFILSWWLAHFPTFSTAKLKMFVSYNSFLTELIAFIHLYINEIILYKWNNFKFNFHLYKCRPAGRPARDFIKKIIKPSPAHSLLWKRTSFLIGKWTISETPWGLLLRRNYFIYTKSV